MTVWVLAFSQEGTVTNAVTVVTFYLKKMLLFRVMTMNLHYAMFIVLDVKK